MSIYTVYRITCIITSSVYVGYTKKTAEQRFKEHMSLYRRKNQKYKIGRAVNKYGPENFFVESLYQTKCRKHAGEIEDQFILEHNSINSGYNIARGGQGGCIVLYKENPDYKKICAKMSIAQQRNKSFLRENAIKNHENKTIGMYNKKHSPETKEKMSISSAWKQKSDDHLERIKISYRKTISAPDYIHPNTGRVQTKIKCEHCSKETDMGNFKRWHGNNCKNKTLVIEEQLEAA
jgi:group I intron endonuclease